MKILVLSLFISSFFSLVNAQEVETKIDELVQHEIRSYSPKRLGVTDLVFEARIDNLTEILTKNLALGKLVDVSFKIYWIAPEQFKIEVHGIPEGMTDLRNDLVTLIKGKLDFVLPVSFSEKLKGYTLKSEPITEGKLIRAIDTTYSMLTSEMNIIFDKNGMLKKLETMSPGSMVKTEFFHSPKGFSNSKLVLDKVVLSNGNSQNSQTTINEIEYLNLNGVGFPSKINIKNIFEYTIPKTDKEKEKKIKKETGSIIRFTKYEVNTGKAQKHMLQSLK